MMSPIQWWRRSLTAKILTAFAAAILLGIGGVAILANQQTTVEFERYLRIDQPNAEQSLASAAADIYRRTNSWDVVARALANFSPGPPRRVVIVDPSGKIVVDTGSELVGSSIARLGLTGGRPVAFAGQVYGRLYLASPPAGPAPGSPSFRFPGFRGGPSSAQLSAAENAFLAQVNLSLLQGALVATLAALILGGLLARQITRPLRELTRVAEGIARGHLEDRLHVNGEDEVAQLARAFNQMAESLQRTEDARRQIVADVAHELRTPLTVIGGTIQAMRDGLMALDDRNLGSIQDEVAALTQLVTDLRDLSLADVGQFPVQHNAVDISRVVEPIVAAFTSEAQSRGITLEVDVAPNLPPLLGDETRLQQCVRNLLANALRHTPVGGRVTVRASATRDAIELQVIDTGEGIAPEHVPHLFERFYRVDSSRTRRSGGTGLGLAIVQQIARAHGGDVTVRSDGLGRGATFTIRLPIKARAFVPTKAAPSPSGSPSPSGRGLG